MKNILFSFLLIIPPFFSSWAQQAGEDILSCEGESVQLNPTISANVHGNLPIFWMTQQATIQPSVG